MRWFWVDSFTEYVCGSHAVGVKSVTLSDDHLHDHWDVFPVMPNSLIAEGMAQTSGLLVSEMYGFKELVVLAKFTKLSFNGVVRPGETIAYEARIGYAQEAGAQCSIVGRVGDRQQAEAEVFFARMQGDGKEGLPQRLFDPNDLCHWLQVVGVFNVGVRQDGTRMKPSDYDLPMYSQGFPGPHA